MADAIISMKAVNKWFGKFHVLRDISLDVGRGERIVICGPSGSGKSTLIRCINRLEEHQKGQIIVEGTEITNDIRDVEAIRRDVPIPRQLRAVLVLLLPLERRDII